jgi:hypothetical protein
MVITDGTYVVLQHPAALLLLPFYTHATTILNATFILVFHIAYCNMFRPHSAIIRCIHSC